MRNTLLVNKIEKSMDFLIKSAISFLLIFKFANYSPLSKINSEKGNSIRTKLNKMNNYSLFDPKYNCEFRKGYAYISAKHANLMARVRGKDR